MKGTYGTSSIIAANTETHVQIEIHSVMEMTYKAASFILLQQSWKLFCSLNK